MNEYILYTNYQLIITLFLFFILIFLSPIVINYTKGLKFYIIFIAILCLISAAFYSYNTKNTIHMEPKESYSYIEVDGLYIHNLNNLNMELTIDENYSVKSDDSSVKIDGNKVYVDVSNRAFMLYGEKQSEYDIMVKGSNKSRFVTINVKSEAKKENIFRLFDIKSN